MITINYDETMKARNRERIKGQVLNKKERKEFDDNVVIVRDVFYYDNHSPFKSKSAFISAHSEKQIMESYNEYLENNCECMGCI